MTLQNSVLATLIYYDILDFPLTAPEVHRYLISPARLTQDPAVGIFTLDKVAQGLESLVKDAVVSSRGGLYFLQGRGELFDLRSEREKIAAKKWNKFLKISKWFQAVPYLRGILASGSLALNNTDYDSDFDVLAVAKSGRLYTCRIFLSLVASLFRARRTRYQSSAPDKFCFNHYITDGRLNIKYESLFNAQTYANLKPVLASNELLGAFYDENLWLNEYIHDFHPSRGFVLNNSPSSFLWAVAKTGEFILDSRLGGWVENWAKKYQQKRIRENPATHESGGRVVFNDHELEFHPRSFEAFAINKYNQNLKKFGIVPFVQEKDSGLTPSRG